MPPGKRGSSLEDVGHASVQALETRDEATAWARAALGLQVLQEGLERAGVGVQGHAVRPAVMEDLTVREIPLEAHRARDGLDIRVVQPEGPHEIGIRLAGPAHEVDDGAGDMDMAGDVLIIVIA